MRTQDKVRQTVRDQREAFSPSWFELGHSQVSISWKNLVQLPSFQGSCHSVSFSCAMKADLMVITKSKGVFIKTGSRPTLCLKSAFWSSSPWSQAQSDKDRGRFIFQNWASFSFTFGTWGLELSTEQKMGLGHAHFQNQVEPRSF